jgi:hypothetical protein
MKSLESGYNMEAGIVVIANTKFPVKVERPTLEFEEWTVIDPAGNTGLISGPHRWLPLKVACTDKLRNEFQSRMANSFVIKTKIDNKDHEWTVQDFWLSSNDVGANMVEIFFKHAHLTIK